MQLQQKNTAVNSRVQQQHATPALHYRALCTVTVALLSSLQRIALLASDFLYMKSIHSVSVNSSPDSWNRCIPVLPKTSHALAVLSCGLSSALAFLACFLNWAAFVLVPLHGIYDSTAYFIAVWCLYLLLSFPPSSRILCVIVCCS